MAPLKLTRWRIGMTQNMLEGLVILGGTGLFLVLAHLMTRNGDGGTDYEGNL